VNHGAAQYDFSVELGSLGLDEGGAVLLRRALAPLAVGARVAVFGAAPGLALHLEPWARQAGHRFEPAAPGDPAAGIPVAGVLVRGAAATSRWVGAVQAGAPDGQDPAAIVERPDPRWGLAARGAFVEAGGRPFDFGLAEKRRVWADEAAALYREALAGQWDPATAIPWETPLAHAEHLEDALVQVLTFLIENETAALIVPARFAAEVHPHFREVQQLLAIQAADEARHIEVFSRRARLKRSALGLSTVGGQESLRTLVEEPDFDLASLLLSVLGEGSFVNLLWFLHRHAPDECTRAMMRLAAQDEARHVAFGVAHLQRHVQEDPLLLPRLAAAIQRRHDALRETAGLNELVFDALVVLAAGTLEPAAVARGAAAVAELTQQMFQGRR